MEYSVVEKGSSQIELQGGYGGGGFIGTLGLSFNNFAVKDLFNKDAYTCTHGRWTEFGIKTAIKSIFSNI